MGVYNVTWALVLLPLFGAAGSFLAETQRRAAQFCATCSVLSLLLAAVVLGARLTHPQQAPFEALLTFFAMSPPEGMVFATRFTPQLGVLVDSLSASFGFVVAFVVAVVQCYALTTLRGDAGYRRFFWVSSVVAFSALALVFSPNLFDSLFVWLIGSVAAYLLAAHWWDRTDAAAPARRALVALRIGDVSLLLGVVVLFIKFGEYSSTIPAPAGQTVADPFGFDQIGSFVTALNHGMVAGAGLRTLAVLACVFIFAAVVRSAQLPFDVWLSDSATAPVAALALIATTVAFGGVYLLAREYPVLLSPFHAIAALALAGAATAVFAAAVALAQRDILRLAAFAVIAQLGLALAALGTGGYGQSMFILFTSLLFGALLILTAGNLIRVYRTRNIVEMGGAWRRMRITSIGLGVWAFGTAGFSLSTYYALSSAFINAKPAGPAVGGVTRLAAAVLVVVTAVLLSLAAWRLLWHACSGQPARRRGFQPERVSEVEPPLRRWTLAATLGAVAGVVVGLPGIGPVHNGKLSIPGMTFTRFVFENVRPTLPVAGEALLIVFAAGVLTGVASLLMYAPSRRDVTARVVERIEPLPRILARGFNLERYAHRAGRPAIFAGEVISRFDDTVSDALGETVAQGSLLASSLGSRIRGARSPFYLAGGVAVVGLIALLSILAVTGHLWNPSA